MSTKNALEIIKRRLEKKPTLKAAYFEEKRNYHIACQIREYRNAAGLTQKALAQRIGTKQSVISRLESAEYTGHSLAILQKISEALHVTIDMLIDVKNDSYQTLTLHIPPIMKNAASFRNWKPNQIIAQRRHA